MVVIKDKVLAIIPAAGIGERLGVPYVPKELMLVPGSFGIEPVIFDSLRRCEAGGISNVVVVTRPDKKLLNLFIDEYLENVFPSLSVTRIDQRGDELKGAVLTAVEDCMAEVYVVLLPDTIARPVDCLVKVLDTISIGADLSLGVFPTKRSCELAPVSVTSHGEVVSIQDKPKNPLVQNTWGVIAFNHSFLHYLIESQNFGESLVNALEHGLITQAVVFKDGSYVDVGTVEGIREAFRQEVQQCTH